MRRWHSARLHGSLGAHAAAWDALNARLLDGHPLLDSRFIDGLLQHFGSGREHLFWCQEEEEGAPLAMCILQPRSLIVWASFLPSQMQIGPTLAGDAALFDDIWRALPRHVLQLDLLCNDPQHSALCANAGPRVQRSDHALTMHVALQGSFEDYLKSRPRNLQQNIKRYQRKLEADSIVPRHVVVDAAAALPQAVARYAELEGQGWKGELGTALNAGGQLAFYQQVLGRAAAVGEAQVHELWFGERLAASRLLLRQGGMWVILKTTYDPGLAPYSPGRVLLLELLRHAFRAWQGMLLEFYTDADQNQLGWGTHARWICHLSRQRNSAADALLSVLRAVGGPRRGARVLGNGRYTIDAVGSVDALPNDARACLEQAGQANSDAGCDWYRNLIETVIDCDDVVRFYVLRRDGLVQAVLPLNVKWHASGWRLHALSTFYTSLYQPALVPWIKAADLMVLLAAVQRDFAGATHLTLNPMDPGSHAYHVLLDALRKLGWLPFEYFSFGNWYLPTDRDWPAYLAARPGAVRSTLKRMGRKFAQAGGTLEIVTGGAQLPQAIAAYEAVYAHSWKVPEPFPGFLPGLMRLCAAQGSLRLGLAWLDGKAVAAQFWIVRHGKAMIYKLAYDEAARQYAPGTLLSAHLMQHAMEVERVQEVDYLQGDDPYKQLWMSQRRERWGIVAYQPRTLAGLGGALREALGRATRGLRGRRRRQRPQRAEQQGWRSALPEQ